MIKYLKVPNEKYFSFTGKVTRSEPPQIQNKMKQNGNIETEKLFCDACKKVVIANGRQRCTEPTLKQDITFSKDNMDKNPDQTFKEYSTEGLRYCPQMLAQTLITNEAVRHVPSDTYLPNTK